MAVQIRNSAAQTAENASLKGSKIHMKVAKKNRNMRLFDSASRLARPYFELSPFERLGIMREYILLARNGDTKMREVLCNPYLMNKRNEYGNPFRGGRGRSYGSLAQSCEAYCKYFWNASATDVVRNRVVEPDDGVID